VGSQVTFNIIVNNRSQTAINNLAIQDRFEPGLEHPESKEKRKIETTTPINLPPGKSYRIDVTFRAAKAGELCHTAEVIRQGSSLAEKRACVVVSAQSGPAPGIAQPGSQMPSRAAPGTSPFGQQPSAAAGIPAITAVHTVAQPAERTVGDVVLYTVQIKNPNIRPLNNVKVTYRADPALKLQQATEGCKWEGNDLAWLIPVLPAGESMQIEVECRCLEPAFKARNTVSVSTSESAQAQAEAFLDIRSTAGGGTVAESEGHRYENAADAKSSADGLTMTVADLRDPVAVGKDLTYEIRVVNNSSTVYRRVTVTATVPEGMVPAPLGTIGPGSTKFVRDGQTMRFNEVMEVQPGLTLIYRVRVRTKSPGQQFRFYAELTSPDLAQPLVREENTEVF